MVHFACSLRRSAAFFVCVLSSVCVAQSGNTQFIVPKVETTGGRVTGFITGDTQNMGVQDILYTNAASGAAPATQVQFGLLLNQSSAGFNNLTQNQVTFTNVSNVVTALADFNNDGMPDYAFALTPTVSGAANFCIYFGTGKGSTSGAYDGPGLPPNNYPPTGAGKSGCTTFAVQGAKPPNFAYIAAAPFKTSLPPPQIFVEDSVNNYLYVLANSGAPGFAGGLPGISLKATIALPAADGAGPIYTGDFNGDNNTDLIVNGQSGNSATVYLGNGDGTFRAPARYVFDHNVHSLLLHDMDGDGHPDMVVEGDGGLIEIFHGNPDGSFGPNSEGGTAPGTNSLAGDGGRLVAISPVSLNILTATPIGLSVLTGNGSLNYAVQGIYNIGPGRSSFALEPSFFGVGVYSLAVDSPEGVAFALGDSGNGFQTSRAYPALAPALGSTIGKFLNAANDPQQNLDVLVNTGAVQGQLLIGDGTGAFKTFVQPTNIFGVPSSVPAGVWSNVAAGDFFGLGNLDILYSLTGLPLPAPGTSANPSGTYFQIGDGDGTFQPPAYVSFGQPANNNFYGESTVADFNGDSVADIANVDALYDDVVLGRTFTFGLNQAVSGNTRFNQVAAGFFKTNRTSKQDVVFQQGSALIPYVNNGSGTGFAAKPALGGTPSPSLQALSALLLTDVDGDGNGDVVGLYYPVSGMGGAPPVAPPQLYLWWGNGDGTFSSSPQVIPLSRGDFLAAVQDMNADGKPDLILSDGSLVTILYNQGSRTFGSEQHFLAGQGINSLSLADVNGDGTPDLIVANGGAVISNAIALGGATASSLTLATNPADINTGGITVLLNEFVSKPENGVLTVAPEPSAYGTTFTLTLTLTPSAGVPVPTGQVTFSIDGAQVGVVTLAPGATTSTATYTVPAGNTYAVGSHTLSASYAGDASNSPDAFAGTHQVVLAPTTSQLLLCIGPAPGCPSAGTVNPPPLYQPTLTMSYGQTWNGIMNATSNVGNVLTGTISLMDTYNGTALPTLCTLSVGIAAACPPSVGTTGPGTGIGTNVLTAVYSGDAGNQPSTSPPVTITVLQI